MAVDHSSLFAAYERVLAERNRKSTRRAPRNALQAFLHSEETTSSGSGFQRMALCR